MSELVGKVANLITSTQIAINRGSRDGVLENSTARLYDLIEIKDPETGEHLGSVRVQRIRFAVTEVSEKYCLAVVADLEPRGTNSSSGLVITNWALSGGSKRKKVELAPATTPGATGVRIGEDIFFTPPPPPPPAEEEPPF